MKIHKFVVAFIQLETAIRLFIDDKNYICAATLAGAAEEIFGNYAEKLTNETAYNLLRDGLYEDLKAHFTKHEVSNQFVNFHRNALKHHDKKQLDEFETDPEFEAIALILRAIYNMTTYKIMTENIKDFSKWVHENRPDLAS